MSAAGQERILGIRHVNETAPRERWLYWDLAFLISGAAMPIGGWALLRRGRRAGRAL